MLDSLLDGLQEASGKLMGSDIVGKVAGAAFVLITVMSGIALLVTLMYLANPEGFKERLSHVLVEKPVMASVEETEVEEVGEVEEVAEVEEVEEVEEVAEVEEVGEVEEVAEVEEVGEVEEVTEVEEVEEVAEVEEEVKEAE